ncbi:MAG: glycosyltransferase family 4 protein, partial [Candidatus Kerfeldbacteria bacterium]|nr:glycosyltransferase family 4 protein [Candidatus Kerfeldbacteria bacterium]
YILYIGRLEKKKNIIVLLRAFEAYRLEHHGTAELVLVGQPGYGWDEAHAFLQQSPVINHVHVLGWESDEHVRILQAHAAATVCISRYEGFGIPPLESLSAGVPVLASRAGSLPEVLGDAALYTDLDVPGTVAADLNRIITDTSLREALRERGLTRVPSFTWDRTAEITARALQAAVLQKGDKYGTVTP